MNKYIISYFASSDLERREQRTWGRIELSFDDITASIIIYDFYNFKYPPIIQIDQQKRKKGKLGSAMNKIEQTRVKEGRGT